MFSVIAMHSSRTGSDKYLDAELPNVVNY